MNIRIWCPYCGNASGKLDSRGWCISCGGQVEIQKSQGAFCITGSPVHLDPWIVGERGREQIIFPDHISPGLPIRGTYYGYDFGIYTIKEIRKMVGLDEK